MNEIINDASSLDIHKLAFVGDAVYELVVREKIACEFNYNIGELNKVKVYNVCCKSQSWEKCQGKNSSKKRFSL